MVNTKRAHYITFGPSIPVVRQKDFSHFPLTGENWKDLWQIVGPSVERNLAQGSPMWKVITAAYAEGLQHGQALNKEAIQLYKEVPINVRSRSIKPGKIS